MEIHWLKSCIWIWPLSDVYQHEILRKVPKIFSRTLPLWSSIGWSSIKLLLVTALYRVPSTEKGSPWRGTSTLEARAGQHKQFVIRPGLHAMYWSPWGETACWGEKNTGFQCPVTRVGTLVLLPGWPGGKLRIPRAQDAHSKVLKLPIFKIVRTALHRWELRNSLKNPRDP